MVVLTEVKSTYIIFRPPEFFQTPKELGLWFEVLKKAEKKFKPSPEPHASIPPLREFYRRLHGESGEEIRALLAEVEFCFQKAILVLKVDSSFPIEGLAALQALATQLNLEFTPSVIPHKGV
jgi:hypothetical protein